MIKEGKNIKTILIADDDTAILDSTRLILEYEGYAVQSVDNGDLLRELKKPLPDLILLDIWLSGTNGGEIASFLKSNPATKNVPIIMFSANRDVKLIAEKSGVEDFLVKPFEIKELLDKISRYLK